MIETNSPLARFTLVIHRLHYHELEGREHIKLESAGNPSLGGAISALLGSIPDENQFSTIEMVRDYSRFMSMGYSAYNFVKKYSRPKSMDVNIRYVNHALEVLSNNSVLSPFTVFTHGNQFSRSSMEHLDALSENMNPYNNEIILEPDELSKILHAVDSLEETLRLSSINDIIKAKMVVILAQIKAQLQIVNLVGSDEVLNNFNIFLGQAVQAGSKATTPEEKESATDLLEKGVNVIGNIQKLVEYAQAATPALLSLGQALGVLPPS